MFLLPILAAASDIGETKAQAERAAVELFARLDADHDGFVSYAEARQGTLASLTRFVPPDVANKIVKNAPDLPVMHVEFDKADTDHDGRLSLAEELAAVDRMFDQQDSDHDGRVTVAERLAYMQRYIAEMQAELAALPKPVCQPGAACETMRRN